MKTIKLIVLTLLIVTSTETIHFNQYIQNHYDVKQTKCLAETIWQESRGESRFGKLAVAQTVLNRVKSNHGGAKTICEVVWSPGQFPWTKDWKNWKHDQHSWIVAVEAQSGSTGFQHFNAHYFHSVDVNPRWPFRKISQIGNHIFYSNEKADTTSNPSRRSAQETRGK